MTTARPRVLAPATIGVLVVIVVLIAGRAIAADPAWNATELRMIAAAGGGGPVLDALARIIDVGLGPAVAPLIGLLVAVWGMLVTGSWRGAVRAGLLLAIPWGVVEVMKVLVRRPRPDAADLPSQLVPLPASFSFPSGHTAFAAALCCAVVLVLAGHRGRVSALVVGVAFVLLVAWSRVHLGVHHPTDVVASLLVVPAVAIPLDAALRRSPLRPRPDR
ncbi:phosphatase PAP2 family protein [Microbacterium luticocti]|uniref:phosphatase PAP2 family protein n=1 Tax=Microbacterium luticocti TaxID=451764 RepID=UPI000687A599|nr:phosphatase PAP2 family protein [Microbacterium luticocti]